MRSRLSCLVLGLAAGCGSSDEVVAGELTAPVVYGADDRVEVYNHPDPGAATHRRAVDRRAGSRAFRISREPNGLYSLFTDSLGNDCAGLCDGELFGRSAHRRRRAQACSSVTTSSSPPVTASTITHPATPMRTSSTTTWTSPTRARRDPRRGRLHLPAGVVSQGSPRGTNFTPDYAVIQLDRPVHGRSPTGPHPSRHAPRPA